jgi:hypothetical protein
MWEHRLLQELWPSMLRGGGGRKTLDDGNTLESTDALIGNRSGRAALKERADVAVGENGA